MGPAAHRAGGSRRHGRRGLAFSTSIPLAAGTSATVALWVAADRHQPDVAWFTLLTGAFVTFVMGLAVLAQRMVGASTRDYLQQMEHRAAYDQLTGLPNRDELLGRLEGALVEGYRHDRVVGLLFLDLDGFKAINDSMGHDAGDELLRAFARRLRDHVRTGDVVARHGGDEFVVVCQGLSRPGAVREVADKLRQAFARPLALSDGEVLVSPSIGIAVASRVRPATPRELIAHADQAMYRAKRERTGIEEFDDASRREVLDRREVERALLPALADGQFRVHYQPIVSVSAGRLTALEALIRWDHPVHGIIGPDRFLPIAEEAGLVARLGDVVLREAAAQLSVWAHLHAEAAALTVSVNLAERQLVDPSFPDRVHEVLDWSGIAPDRLVLEVGEDLLLRRADDANRVLHRLHGLGCRLVIDDFGTSQTALARIHATELVDGLKVDRTITAAILHDEVARGIVEATVSIARAMGVSVAAEGVETVEQRELLTELGIDLMQGFLFLRPSPPEAFDLDRVEVPDPGGVAPLDDVGRVDR